MVFSKNNVKMFKWNHEKHANGFTSISVEVCRKKEQETEKHHHHAMVWPLIDHSSQPIRVPKLAQLLKKDNNKI